MSSESSVILEKNRNFICSCGKAYLSYAALFTHIKQKHGGKAPGEIVRPRSQNKRGRPRKTEKMASDKTIKSLFNLDLFDKNHIKNNNFSNQSNFDDNLSRFQQPYGIGFRSYKEQKKNYKSKSNPQLPHVNLPYHLSLRQHLKLSIESEEESNIELSNLNNEFSSNTIKLAQVIIYLRQLFKGASQLEEVHNEDLKEFSSYEDLRQFHSQKLAEGKTYILDEKVFLLGNLVCGFLNFCQQTIQSKAGYQQIVLLIVCLLDYIKISKKVCILRQCLKDVIYECLGGFFSQYLGKVIIKYKLNFWIFKQNNAYNVIIWFLNWISTIQNNLKKNQNNLIQNTQSIKQQQKYHNKNYNGKQNQSEKELNRLSGCVYEQINHAVNNRQLNNIYNKSAMKEQQAQQQDDEIQCEFQQFVQQFDEQIVRQLNEQIIDEFDENIQRGPQNSKFQQNEAFVEGNDSVKDSPENRPLLEA